MSGLDNKKILFCVSDGKAAHQLPELIAALLTENVQVSVLMAPAAGEWISRVLLTRLGATVITDVDPMADGSWDGQIVLVDEQLSESGKTWLGEWLRALYHRQPRGSGTLFLASDAALAAGEWPELTAVIGQPDRVIAPQVRNPLLASVDPAALIAALHRIIDAPLLAGRRVLVTAGPTYEDIDPVRYIGNRSSGKMGYAVAGAAWQAGAEVLLISGPVGLPSPHGVTVTKVRSALEMQTAVDQSIADQDIYISSAAVADYRPAEPGKQKMKKGKHTANLSLVANPDLLARVASRSSAPFCVGFAAETEQVEAYARGKLVNKKLQMIAANRVGTAEGGFESDQNRLHLFWPGGERQLPLSSKRQQAQQLIEVIAERFNHWNNETEINPK